MRGVMVAGTLGWVVAACGPALAQKGPDPVCGVYAWSSGTTVTLRVNGTASARDPGKEDRTIAGRWMANPYGGYVLMWDNGNVDRLELSATGRKLEGSGLTAKGELYRVWGNKK